MLGVIEMITNAAEERRSRSTTGILFFVAAAALMFSAESLADSGFYIGGSVGQAGIEIDDSDPVQPIDFDEDDFAWKAFAGYNFGLTVVDLGIEIGYVNLGKPSADILGSSIEIETDGLDAFGVLGIALGPIGVFGKYGVISWDAKGTVDGLPAFDEDGSDPAYGVGAKFGLGSLDIRVEYEIFDIEDAEDVSMISAGLVWSF
jgi:outer membrane immunogenic protein